MKLCYKIRGGDFVNAGNASSSVKRVLKQLNIESTRIKNCVVSLYEAEVNVAAHADEGEVYVEISEERIKIVVDDRGPGIRDIELAMKEGYSTASPEVREMGFGAGMGLPNIKRNSDLMEIFSTPGKGTRLEILINL